MWSFFVLAPTSVISQIANFTWVSDYSWYVPKYEIYCLVISLTANFTWVSDYSWYVPKYQIYCLVIFQPTRSSKRWNLLPCWFVPNCEIYKFSPVILAAAPTSVISGRNIYPWSCLVQADKHAVNSRSEHSDRPGTNGDRWLVSQVIKVLWHMR